MKKKEDNSLKFQTTNSEGVFSNLHRKEIHNPFFFVDVIKVS